MTSRFFLSIEPLLSSDCTIATVITRRRYFRVSDFKVITIQAWRNGPAGTFFIVQHFNRMDAQRLDLNQNYLNKSPALLRDGNSAVCGMGKSGFVLVIGESW
jgi:hypothetical protein